MREASSKEGTIHAAMSSGFRRVDVFAPPTVKLNRLLVRSIGESNWQERLTVTENARTASKVGFLELFELTSGEVSLSHIVK